MKPPPKNFFSNKPEPISETFKPSDEAPNGQVINQMEAIVLKRGRELIRQSLELALQEEVEEHEKKRNCVRNADEKKENEDTKTKKS